jgi:hypothetical protein
LRREGLRERKWEAYSVILLCFLCCGKINRVHPDKMKEVGPLRVASRQFQFRSRED